MAGPMDISVEPSGRVVYTLVGDLTKDRLPKLEEQMREARQEILKQYYGTGRKVRILMDLTGYSDRYDVQTMEAFADFASADADFVEKTAGFGGSIQSRAAARIVVALANRNNIRFFAEKKEAIEWLDS